MQTSIRACATGIILSSSSLVFSANSTLSQLDEVVVTAARVTQTVDQSLAATTIITRQQIDQTQSVTVVDLLRKYSPGIDFTVRGGRGKNSGMHMRGTETDHILVLIDGVRAGSATLGAMAWGTLSSDMIERVEIVRGPRSSLYGSDAIGGIISITTRNGKVGTWHASAAVGSYQTKDLTGGGTFGTARTQFSINGSFVDTDGLDTRVTNNPDDDGYDNQAINLRFNHNFSERSRISVAALHEQGSNEYDDFGDDNRSSYNDFLQQNISVTGHTQFTDNWNSSLIIGQYKDESESFDSFPGVFNNQRSQLSWQNDLALGGSSLLAFGLDHQVDEINTTISYDEDSRYNTGLYAEYLGNIGAHELQLSARVDDNEAFGSQSTGSITVSRQLRSLGRVVVSYGTAFKAPTFNELYFPNFGNANLEPEESETFELGLRSKVAGGVLNFNLFRTDIDNLIAAVLVDADTFTFQPQNINKARIDGLEVEVGKSFDKLRLNSSLMVLYPIDRNTRQVLESRVKSTLKFNLEYDFNRVSIGGSLLAQSRRAKGAFSNELAGYMTQDLRAAYHFSNAMQLRVEVNNVFDKVYQTKDGFNMPERNIMLTFSYRQ